MNKRCQSRNETLGAKLFVKDHANSLSSSVFCRSTGLNVTRLGDSGRGADLLFRLPCRCKQCVPRGRHMVAPMRAWLGRWAGARCHRNRQTRVGSRWQRAAAPAWRTCQSAASLSRTVSPPQRDLRRVKLGPGLNL